MDIFDEAKKRLNNEVITVTQFNSLIKDIITHLGEFHVKGEITEFRITQNKGVYITLSDGKANVKVSGYAPTIRGIDLIESGMDVVVTGIADLYVPYGTFSISASKIEPVGEGSLAIAYQKLKEKLDKEGLFAHEHKQELPKFITKIALLTGKDSAAYSDFVKILREQEVSIKVLYYPVIVQGPKSVKSVSSALLDAQSEDFDCIVLTRGGGSLEDLKAFNDEELSRLIFKSRIPVIVGVGHEKDESIADFVADKRASTPSQAAYYISEQNQRFLEDITLLGDEINEYLKSKLDERYEKFHKIILDIENFIAGILDKIKNKIESLERILVSFNLENVLKRGFAVIEKDGKKITSVRDLKKNDLVGTLLSDGRFKSKVKDINYYKS